MKVLHESHIAVLFHDSKNGAVAPAAGRLNDAELESFKHVPTFWWASGILNCLT